MRIAVALWRIMPMICILISSNHVVYSQSINENRYALVIGNSHYQDLSALSFPEENTNFIKKALEELNFNVNCLEDSDLSSMKNSFSLLESKLRENSNSVGLFFFSGYAVQMDVDGTFLLASDSKITYERSQIKKDLLSLYEIIDAVKDENNTIMIIIIDSEWISQIPWAHKRIEGFWEPWRLPKNMLLAFGKKQSDMPYMPNKTKSIFTEMLLKNLSLSNLDISEILIKTQKDVIKATDGSQTPIVRSTICRPLYLKFDN